VDEAVEHRAQLEAGLEVPVAAFGFEQVLVAERDVLGRQLQIGGGRQELAVQPLLRLDLRPVDAHAAVALLTQAADQRGVVDQRAFSSTSACNQPRIVVFHGPNAGYSRSGVLRCGGVDEPIAWHTMRGYTRYRLRADTASSPVAITGVPSRWTREVPAGGCEISTALTVRARLGLAGVGDPVRYDRRCWCHRHPEGALVKDVGEIMEILEALELVGRIAARLSWPAVITDRRQLRHMSGQNSEYNGGHRFLRRVPS